MKVLIEIIKRFIPLGSKVDVNKIQGFAKTYGKTIPNKKLEQMKTRAKPYTMESGSVNESKIETKVLERDEIIKILEK